MKMAEIKAKCKHVNLNLGETCSKNCSFYNSNACKERLKKIEDLYIKEEKLKYGQLQYDCPNCGASGIHGKYDNQPICEACGIPLENTDVIDFLLKSMEENKSKISLLQSQLNTLPKRVIKDMAIAVTPEQIKEVCEKYGVDYDSIAEQKTPQK